MHPMQYTAFPIHVLVGPGEVFGPQHPDRFSFHFKALAFFYQFTKIMIVAEHSILKRYAGLIQSSHELDRFVKNFIEKIASLIENFIRHSGDPCDNFLHPLTSILVGGYFVVVC